jgi:hypothetical protein
MQDVCDYLPSSFENDNLDTFAFPVLQAKNTIFIMLEMSEIGGDKHDLSHIVVKETSENVIESRRKIIFNWVENNDIRIIDVDLATRLKIIHNVTLLELTASKWRYICSGEGGPFKHCVCGEVAPILHCIQNKFSPEKILYIEKDCAEILYGSSLHTLSESVNDFIEDVSYPCGISLIEYAYSLKFITENEMRMLLQDAQYYNKNGQKLEMSYMNCSEISTILTYKLKVAQAFVRWASFEKVKSDIITEFYRLLVVTNYESSVISVDELNFIKTNYWKKMKPLDQYAAMYQAVCEKKANGKFLSQKEQKSYSIFIESRAPQIREDDIDFLRLKAEFLSTKKSNLETVQEKIRSIISDVQDAQQNSISDHVGQVITYDPCVSLTTMPILLNEDTSDPKHYFKKMKEAKSPSFGKSFGLVPESTRKAPEKSVDQGKTIEANGSPTKVKTVTMNGDRKTASTSDTKNETKILTPPKDGMRWVTANESITHSKKQNSNTIFIPNDKFNFVDSSIYKMVGATSKDAEKVVQPAPQKDKQVQHDRIVETEETFEENFDSEENFEIGESFETDANTNKPTLTTEPSTDLKQSETDLKQSETDLKQSNNGHIDDAKLNLDRLSEAQLLALLTSKRKQVLQNETKIPYNETSKKAKLTHIY